MNCQYPVFPPVSLLTPSSHAVTPPVSVRLVSMATQSQAGGGFSSVHKAMDFPLPTGRQEVKLTRQRKDEGEKNGTVEGKVEGVLRRKSLF